MPAVAYGRLVLVALVLAVLAAVVATSLLLVQRRALAAARAEAAAATGRAATAELAAADAGAAAAAAEARASTLEVAEQAAARTAGDHAQALADCERRRAESEAELERCTDASAEARRALAGTAASLERSEAAASSASTRVTELEQELRTAGRLAEERGAAIERLEARRSALEHQLDGLAGRPAQPAGEPPDGQVLEPCWRLLLSRIEHQWASTVGAGPDERGITAGGHDQQLAQALARELERLREEVGLHTDATITGTMAAVHPLLVLLTAGELATIAAPHSERLVVELGAGLLVVGEGWTGGLAEGDLLGATLRDAGLQGSVEATHDSVRVAVGVAGEGRVSRRS